MVVNLVDRAKLQSPIANILLHLEDKFGQVGAPRNRPGGRAVRCGFIVNQKGIRMDKTIVVKLAAAAAVFALAGCTDLKPVQADIDSLKQQVASLQTAVNAAKTSADNAATAAQAAQTSANQAAQAASGAQSTANQALSAAQAAQSSVDATNEKINRMFKKSVSK
jgi:hypothetical protein